MCDGKDYIGGINQLPTGLRLVNVLAELLFCNGYCVTYKVKKGVDLDKTCREGGWLESKGNSKALTKQRRSNVSVS